MWTLWFKDGGNRQLINSTEELYELGQRYGFNGDDGIAFNEIEMTDDGGNVIGGVFSNFDNERKLT